MADRAPVDIPHTVACFQHQCTSIGGDVERLYIRLPVPPELFMDEAEARSFWQYMLVL